MYAGLENRVQDELCESWDSSGICGKRALKRHVRKCLIILQKSMTWHFNFRMEGGIQFLFSFVLFLVRDRRDCFLLEGMSCQVWVDVEDIKSALCLLRHRKHFRVKTELEQKRYCYTSSNGYVAHKKSLA